MIGVTLEGALELSAKLDAFPAQLMRDIQEKAGQLAAALADKVKYEKLGGEVLTSRSGRLQNAIAAEVVVEGTDVTASVFVSGDVKYAAIQEYGGRTAPHDIVPTKADALAFLAGGSMRFAKVIHHPGSQMPERSYLRSSLDEMSAEIVAALAETPKTSWEST